MKRILAWIVTLGISPAPVYALGLGKLELESGLNQPFEAKIELLSPTREELDSLTVRLADIEAFQRARIDRPFVLSGLRFELRESEEGPDYVRVYSRDAVREPFLNFLLEANWTNGRLFREYTVLLDPPLYDVGARAPAEPAVQAAAPPAAEGAVAQPPLIPSADQPAEVIAGSYTGGDYGPTVATDTLWSIASRSRPDSAISVQQMMLALLRTNPDAFISGNVNGLKRGEILRIPGREEITTLSIEEAFAQVKAQYAAWQEQGGAIAATTPQRPLSAARGAGETGAVPESTGAAAVEGKSELKLVAATEQATGAGQSGTGTAPTSGDGKLSESLALANEQVEALSQENLELKDRVTEAETIIEDLKRLIALKDDELAALQQKLVAEAPAQPRQAAPAVEVEKPAGGEAEAERSAPAAAPAVKAEEEKAAKEPEAVKPPPPEPEAEEAVETAPAPKAPAPPAPAEAPPGLVGQLRGIIAGNILIIGAAAGILAIVAVALVIVRRRKRRESEAAGAVALEFPDFTGSEAETEIPGMVEAGPEVKPGLVEPVVEAKAPPRARPEAAAKPAAPAPPAAPAAKPAPAPAPAEPQEDPLAEVNVFLAYEHFDAAEEFVRDAINREPDNLEFHAKLLEVLYAAGAKKKYEEAAKVLHDKVNGAGPYWETAVAVWQEMSPNRALFAEPVAGEEEAPIAAAGGGMLDLTAEEPAKGTAADMGLDFDLGEATAEPAAKTPARSAAAEDEDQVLDITAGAEDAGALEMTAAPAEEEGVLDVTAAVGLESLELAPEAGGEQPEEEILDISQAGGEDLLDVTAHADLNKAELEEDLLDVTMAAGGSKEEEELLEASAEAGKEAAEGTLDFDLNLGGVAAPEAEEAVAQPSDNVIDFDSGGFGAGAPEKEDALDLDFTAGGVGAAGAAESGLELELGAEKGEAESVGELSLEDTEGGGLELDVGGDEAALEIEMEDSSGSDAGGGLEAGLEIADSGSAGSGEEGFELDLSMEEEPAPAGGTAAKKSADVPQLELDTEDEEDDGGDHTVFVPRTSDAQEQSAEDEVATKLDLAKAYVELGDKDSARTILDEVMTGGNAQQRRQAQELIKQLS